MLSSGCQRTGWVSRVTGHWWAYLWGRVAVDRSLRYSTLLGLVATTLASVFTYLAVGLGPGIEVNPVMSWAIGTLGWLGFAVVRYAVVVGLFFVLLLLTYLGNSWLEWSEANGRMIAAILWLNAIRDGIVIATGVTPTAELLAYLGLL